MLDSPLVTKLIALALEEDLAFGDCTTDLLISSDAGGTATVLCKEDMVICGLPLVPRICGYLTSDFKWRAYVEEGSFQKSGSFAGRLDSTLSILLKVERTLLNIMQRMSGVATHTRQIVAQAAPLKVLDTRKTLPGWRLLDKYAVRIGGAHNHRLSLGDMILVKNNHVDALEGGMQEALEKITKNKPPYLPLEVEVRTKEELEVALTFSPTIVMLDNFTNEEIVAAIELIKKAFNKPLIEISGGMTAARCKELAHLEIDFISIGALTHKAQSVDISLRISRLVAE